MHLRHSDHDHGPKTVKVRFVLENPAELIDADHFTGDPSAPEHEIMAAIGEHLLEVAVENGINIEHACGAVCACSTCHVYVEQGMDALSEATEQEEDRVEEAPGLQRTSRLSCQCFIEREQGSDGPIVVRVPAWNRNAIKEIPH